MQPSRSAAIFGALASARFFAANIAAPLVVEAMRIRLSRTVVAVLRYS